MKYYSRNNQQKLLENQKKRAEEEEESKEPVDMTKSQIKRDEVKVMMGEINNVVGEIDNLFSSVNQKVIMEARSNKTPKYNNSKYTKAEEPEEFSVATGIVPDWAITKMESANQEHIDAANHIYSGSPNYGYHDSSEKNIDGYGEIELENAESWITLQPSAKNNFMIESSEHKDKELAVEDIYNQEDDEEYNMDVDEKEYYNLKATTTDNKVRNSFFCDRENQEGNNQFTGKFGDDDNRETEEDLNVYEHRPTPTSYEQSYKEKRDQEKMQKNKEQLLASLDESNDISSVEIEDILIKNKAAEPKIQVNVAPKRQEWNKNSKRNIAGQNANSEKDRLYFEDENLNKDIQEGIISLEDMPDRMLDEIDLIAQTPKPNLKYPVPSRENEFGEASFGNQSKQFHNLRSKNSTQQPSPYNQGSDYDSNSKGSFKYDQTSITVNKESSEKKQDSDSKSNLKSKIPSIKKTESKFLDSKKHIRSFIEENTEELEEAPIPYSKVEDKSENNDFGPEKFNNINVLGVPNSKAKMENASIANNYNISNNPGDKSDSISDQEEIGSQNEDSVHFDEARENQRYIEGQSYGDSVLVGTTENSYMRGKADPVATAAINSNLNSEISKINQALLNINLILNQKDSKEVSLIPDVANNLNKSLNLWNSMMISLNSNSENQSTLQKSLHDSYWFSNSFAPLQANKEAEDLLLQSISDKLLQTVMKKLEKL